MSEEKNQAELEIEALADIFGIATTGFEEFYKKFLEQDLIKKYNCKYPPPKVEGFM